MNIQVSSFEANCKTGAPGIVITSFGGLRLLFIPRHTGIRRSIPGWFFCFLGGALLLIPCHILIARKGWQARFSPLVLSYLALMFLFATILWFLLFAH